MNLKQRLSAKLKRKSGFTLIEMLIVVAIIVILVAVSIPMVTSSLDKAKEATDAANLRSAEAAAMIAHMSSNSIPATQTYYYDADTGKAYTEKDKVTSTGYNQMEQTTSGSGSSSTKISAKAGIVQVNITPDGITSTWVSK